MADLSLCNNTLGYALEFFLLPGRPLCPRIKKLFSRVVLGVFCLKRASYFGLRSPVK
uniref:Uncharacterized protein n=1 Tax=Lepeophtheirus salmonis TaxID=72036 RepID=A0A0K2TCT7_LEPSM